MNKIIFYLVVLQSLVIAQDLSKDFEILAKYSILKNSIENNFSSFDDSTMILSSINKLEDIVINNNYIYEVQSIDSISSHLIISILDKTNFQLHGQNSNVYAINKTESSSRYFNLTKSNLLEYINDQIYPEISTKDQFKLINFYNSILNYFAKQIGREVEFYSTSNAEEFNYLDNVYNLRNIVTSNLIGKRDYYEHIYFVRSEDSNIIEFYQLIYFFNCDQMKVEKYLLLKTKI